MKFMPKAVHHNTSEKKENLVKEDVIIALAGNPNVGKTTIFNALTGLHQHTGNWPGKTVASARGRFIYKKKQYILTDIPGTYSLMAHSTEEEIARDFLLSSKTDAVVVVCDATCLLRNLNLVLQTMEITDKVIVCVNLIDEAKRKHIKVQCALLSQRLGVPVIPASAGKKQGLKELCECIHKVTSDTLIPKPKPTIYRPEIEKALAMVLAEQNSHLPYTIRRFYALRALENNEFFFSGDENPVFYDTYKKNSIAAQKYLAEQGLEKIKLRDAIVEDIYKNAEEICRDVVITKNPQLNQSRHKIDRILTGRKTGIPIMLILLFFILWLTISGANYPSAILSELLFGLETPLFSLLTYLGAPLWLQNALVTGVYRVLAWVVSVMLPPMAIFFPLFTLLEDLGYLPRIAFNLDLPFKKCAACGKQALTMCMGFGCNAVGVTGCRIVDSPRERLIAILTNSFVPCNGRFPTLISLLSIFFLMGTSGFLSSLSSAILLTCIILLGILLTFVCSKLLSKTLLKGFPSSFALELPPYRKPQIGKVLIRSAFDRTLFVLGRAVSVAAPAGLIIYIMANYEIGGMSLLTHTAGFLDPFARIFGLDGVILMAFILGFPANEIVMPIAVMAYLSGTSLVEIGNTALLHEILVQNGWTPLTAICTMVFSLLHWPCSTTLITIKKETRSVKWTLIAFLLPTLFGFLLCFLLAQGAGILSRF